MKNFVRNKMKKTMCFEKKNLSLLREIAWGKILLW